MKKIIIDTDPGHDDAMALMLAVKCGLFDVKAVTTVCGNSTISNTTRNARFILDLLEKDNIPIFSGAKQPLKKKLIQAVVHGKSGLEGIDPINEPGLTNNAVDKTIEIVTNNPNQITLITLGPLTNVAKAILKNSDAMDKVREIISMGGAIRVPGNKNRVAEFNIFVDPEAADIVFRFPVKKTIIPLDACNNVRLTLSDFKKIKNSKLRRILIKMTKPYIKNIFEDTGINAALMYDPLTVFYLINPNAATTFDCNIEIETKSELTRGMTVADLRKNPEGKNNVTVVSQINEKEFKQYFIKTLSK